MVHLLRIPLKLNSLPFEYELSWIDEMIRPTIKTVV